MTGAGEPIGENMRRRGDGCTVAAGLIAAGAALPRYILRVVRTQGEAARRAEIDVTTPRQWRSDVLDAIMSV